MKSFAASNAYVSAVHDLIPGGAHTYAKGDDQYPAGMAPVIERGAGCRVWDIDGNEYVEFGSGLRSNILGHGFEPVVQAARRWLDQGVNFVRPHRIELEAAERLTDLIPSAEMVKFGLNGSDATTAAVRLARAYTGRDMVADMRRPALLLHRRLVHRDHADVRRDPRGDRAPHRQVRLQRPGRPGPPVRRLPGPDRGGGDGGRDGPAAGTGLLRRPAPPVRPARSAAHPGRDDHRLPLA